MKTMKTTKQEITPITQAILKEYQELHSWRTMQESIIRAKKKREDEIKELLISADTLHAPIEKGELTFEIQDGRKYPAWKAIFISQLGIEEAVKAENQTVPSKQVIVKKR